MNIEQLATKHGVTVKFAEMMMGIGVTHSFVPDESMRPGQYREVSQGDTRRPHKTHPAKAGKRRRRHSLKNVPDLV